MPTTNRDASVTTTRRRQVALYAWRQSTGYSGAPTTRLLEQGISTGGQGTGPSSGVSVDARIGAGICRGANVQTNPGGNTR